ncbi:M20 family metallo-hydrolase [Pontibacter silvestris]|uniref:M20 family metallo-hydrolase n=1 Tax=Pontibacter silvestris TaxID=2305183 RepID=A0ABW4X0K8_9BACT|nr:M20 family metallo-hydrolase [Pontibacter silvestris]MCC9135337.1 M20 family metallo-hydrolase [Pontibacter silvestris]
MQNFTSSAITKQNLFDKLYKEALGLLKQLISTESLSRQEDGTAKIIFDFMQRHSVDVQRKGNNIWAFNKYFNSNLPTVLLNSHHDTVRPNPSWTINPFKPLVKDGKLYGLGSNDAGGCLISLIATFLYFYNQQNLKYNIVIAATAEEEVSGTGGIENILQELGKIDFAIVGEPTQMHLAVAEKGLLVLDCVAHGKTGHAAREEGLNAIYEALPDIAWFRNYQFENISETLGPIKMTVTVIEAGKQHNVVPDTCKFTVDVRVTDAYTLEEVLETVRKHVKAEVSPRSVRLQPSSISLSHPIVQAGLSLGRTSYGSPTTSDQALLPVPSLKLGPGDSARSHTADEFIYLDELQEGVSLYVQMLEKIVL